jgi:hypothetical protein
MDPIDIPLDLAGKIAQKQKKDPEAELKAEEMKRAEPAIQLAQVRIWAVEFFRNLKDGVRQAVERMNSSGTQKLQFQDNNEYVIALINQSTGVRIDASLFSVPTESNDTMPAIKFSYQNGKGEPGELLLYLGQIPSLATSWLMADTGTVFGDGSIQSMAEAILRYVLNGSFGIPGIYP